MIFLPFWPFNLWPWSPSWIIPTIPPLTPVKPTQTKEIITQTFGDWIRFNWREPPQNPSNVNAQQVPAELQPLITMLVSTMQSIGQLLPIMLIVPLIGSLISTIPLAYLQQK